MTGFFITIEGPDGAGKSTQVRLLAEYLREKGLEVVVTREPGGTPLAEKIRNLVLDVSEEPVAPVTEVLLYAASRAQHVDQLIKPALQRGAVVISDRFVDSSIAYQGFGRRLGAALVWQVNRPAVGEIMPHLSIILDIEPGQGRRRLARRQQLQQTGPDRLEQEQLVFHHRVREGFLALAKEYPERIKLLSAEGSIDSIHQQIVSLIEEKINSKGTDRD